MVKSKINELKEEKLKLEIEALKNPVKQKSSTLSAFLKAIAYIILAYIVMIFGMGLGGWVLGVLLFWIVIGFGVYRLAKRMGWIDEK